MAAHKLINFRCPDDLLARIESYGRERYSTVPGKRSSVDYDQSKAIRDILTSGLDSPTLGEVKQDRESVKLKSDNSPYIEEILDRITKLENQQLPPTLDPTIEARLENLEAALAGK